MLFLIIWTWLWFYQNFRAKIIVHAYWLPTYLPIPTLLPIYLRPTYVLLTYYLPTYLPTYLTYYVPTIYLPTYLHPNKA